MGLITYSILFLMTIGFALGVLFNKNTVKSAVCLVFTMLCIAANYLLMRNELLAFFQVVVYAGAIMVLFLFVIMLLNLREPETTPWYLRNARFWAGALALAFFFIIAFGIQVFAVSSGSPATLAKEEAIAASDTSEVILFATQTITKYVVPFVLTSVLLLVAVIGAIVMARRKDEDGNEIVVDEEYA